ncbi:PKD domain-containing protein [Flavobacterium algicola]|uniref:PKD domain-containing protein n=1 Tax=Flavobacterium algicola TaxID=556529 RepID=UPI001EFC6BBA|nr:PKD domain-containing protein [Flavobacterium algicola]MCG9791359.1 PKD domain-containing protein [Flavobacterium algicola]
MKNNNIIKRIAKFSSSAVALMACFLLASCDPTIDSLKFDLPEANSKEDLNPPIANFAATETADYLTYTFSNTSSSATDYTWNYGDGSSSVGKDGSNTFPAEGTYTVSLTAIDKLGKTSTFTSDIVVVKPIIPPSIIPDILNGDFSDGQDNWKFSSFSGGTTSPYNTSGDGSWLNYDGSDNGSKTAGAKWTQSTSAGVYTSSKTRYAYQAILITPNTPYILEYEYAIKTEAEQDGVAAGGNRIIGEILNGQFSDGADAIASSTAGPLAQDVGLKTLGKTTFTKVTKLFTSNATGAVSILIYGVTDVDAYVDNVKVYPAN